MGPSFLHRHNPEKLPTRALMSKMHELIANEREKKAEFIACLSEVSARRLHLAQGFSSLYEFCLANFSMSEGAIYRRIQVANVVKKFPQILDFLATGAVSLTVASLLCPYFRGENVCEILDQCSGMTRRETESYIRKRFGRQEDRGQNSVTGLLHSSDPAKPFSCEEQFSPELTLYKFYAGENFQNTLREVRQLHLLQRKSVDLEDVFLASMEALLARHKKNATVKASTAHSRHIPLSWRLQLMQKAGYQCTFRGSNGRRCVEKKYLEVDHIIPFAQGGRTELENLQVLCRAHNQYKAGLDYGFVHMEKFASKGKNPPRN